ncbi:MAG: (Fe-S)-binding protein [Pseudomonadota bacterium]
MRVGVFIPCFVSQLRPATAERLIVLLQRLGVDLVLPEEAPVCCGQPSYNAGLWSEAACCAEKLVRAFAGVEQVVVPSASCAAMVQRYPEIPELDPALRNEVEQIARRTTEVCRFLVQDLGVEDLEVTRAGRVAYHDGCHGLRELGLRDEPRLLLRKVRGLELCELAGVPVCCGFGGTFSIKYPEISVDMADHKLALLARCGTDTLVSADLSCLLHLESRARRRGVPFVGLHVLDVLVPEVAA